MDVTGYLALFGESGATLSETQWVDHANEHLTPSLAALNARYVAGSRSERWLRMAFVPGPSAHNIAQLSGGTIAEMLDQAATHCGSLVTGYPCPTLNMTVTILRAGSAKSYLATGRVLKLTSVAAVLGADLEDDDGRQIATVTLVSQLIKDVSRLTG
jgi:acyl-coenzyme A thioesterase PaaI-like protein